MDTMAGNRLTTRPVGKFSDRENPPMLRWRAEFTRGKASPPSEMT